MNNTSEGLIWTLGNRLLIAHMVGCEGMSLGEFARRIGISRNSVRNYEKMITTVKPPVLRAWADVTGYPLEWLTSDADTDLDASSTALEIAQIRALRGFTDDEKESLIAARYPNVNDGSAPASGRRVTG